MSGVRIGLVLGFALAIRPAHGHHQIPEAALRALTMVDRLATKAELVAAFSGMDATIELVQIAADPASDLGVRIRAIRALPVFCPTSCAGTTIHSTLVGLLGEPTLDGQAILRTRAALEALGAARTADPNDLVVVASFLSHSNRDLRAASAHALRTMCNTQALPLLRARYQVEQVEQVRQAISAALRDLGNCT